MRQMIAGNWKMNGLTHDAEALAGSILEAFERTGARAGGGRTGLPAIHSKSLQ